MASLDTLHIDLSDLAIADIEVLAQEGGRGIPEFAASTCSGSGCHCLPSPTGGGGGCSCTIASSDAE